MSCFSIRHKNNSTTYNFPHIPYHFIIANQQYVKYKKKERKLSLNCNVYKKLDCIEFTKKKHPDVPCAVKF